MTFPRIKKVKGDEFDSKLLNYIVYGHVRTYFSGHAVHVYVVRLRPIPLDMVLEFILLQFNPTERNNWNGVI